MSADGSQPPTDNEDWFQPGTHSLWLYDREGRGKPALVAVYEWEIVGLRGVQIEAAWGDLVELEDSKGEWDEDYTMLRGEISEQEELATLAFAELVAAGSMRRIGVMPAIEGFSESPIGFEKRRAEEEADICQPDSVDRGSMPAI